MKMKIKLLMKRKSFLIMIGIFVLVLGTNIILALFDEPFSITEIKTDYGIAENTIWLEVTELLDKDQYITNISEIFANHPLTDEIQIQEILLKQDYESDVYDYVDESQGKYTTFEVISNETIYYYDNNLALMDCDYVLEDKSCMKLVYKVIGIEIKQDYFNLPSLKEKIVIDGLKIEQKQSGLSISLTKSGIVYLKIKYSHPLVYRLEVSDIVNKYDIEITTGDGSVVLDPKWIDSDWAYGFPVNYTFVTQNVGYKQVNLTILNETDIDLSYFNSAGEDFRIFNATDSDDPCNNADSELDYFIESWDSSRVDLVINFSSIINNTAQPYCIYAGNDAVETTSNGDTTFRFFDDFSGDLSKWTIQPKGGTIDIVSGRLHMKESALQQIINVNSTSLNALDTFTIIDFKVDADIGSTVYGTGGASDYSASDCYYISQGATEKSYRDGTVVKISETNWWGTETDVTIKFINSNHMDYTDSEGDTDLNRLLTDSVLPKHIRFTVFGNNAEGFFDDVKVRSYVTSKTASYGIVTTKEAIYTLNGTVKDSNNIVVNNATIIIINQADNTIFGLTESNSTGGWNYAIDVGTYLIVAYDPNNLTRDGDADPHIIVS